MYTRLGCQGRPPQFVVEYYPYANLSHAIRLKEHIAYVRLSDVLRMAPLVVVEAAAALLLARLYGCEGPERLLKTYREFCLAHATRRRIARLRRTRARAAQQTPNGQHFNLGHIFTKLNQRYFGGQLRAPKLGWSIRPWRSQLGFFEPALCQITINSRLDSPRIPRFVVEYVLFHEMLHVRHPQRRARCGLQSHSPQFRREEKEFRCYKQARKFLSRLF